MSATLVSLEACPICRTPLPPDAAECPNCGESFSEASVAAADDVPAITRLPGFREKFLYYAGIALILLGGPGLALGSWLHDVLRISFMNYDSFNVFGPVNRLVLGLGLIVMIVGVVFLILSLRLSRPAEYDDTDESRQMPI